MNTVLTAAVIVSGLIVTVESACDPSLCTIGSDCTTLAEYISCLGTEYDACTNSVAHEAMKLTITGVKDAASVTRGNLNCSGAASFTVSLAALLLAAVVSFFKA